MSESLLRRQSEVEDLLLVYSLAWPIVVPELVDRLLFSEELISRRETLP